MKKTFEYIGLFVLVAFSFYYTDKVVKMVNKNDPLMKEIVTYASINNTSCVEGYTTEDGVILGVSGLVVDEHESYSNMKGFGYNEDLFVFDEDTCSINKAEYIDKYNSDTSLYLNVALYIIYSISKVTLSRYMPST